MSRLTKRTTTGVEALERMEEHVAKLEAKWAAREKELTSLRSQLNEVTAERDAAVSDMKLISDAAREAHCDETCCFACKYDGDFSITDTGDYANECPGFDKDDCFEWRGLQKERE